GLAYPASRQIESIDSVILWFCRVVEAEVKELDLLDSICVHPFFQSRQILSPVKVGIDQYFMTILRSSRNLIEKGKIIGIDARARPEVPKIQKTYGTSFQLASALPKVRDHPANQDKKKWVNRQDVAETDV